MPFEGGAAFFTLNGSWLSLYPWDALAEGAAVAAAGTGFRGTTLAQAVSSREEVVEVLDQAVRSGGKLVKKAQDLFWGGYSGYFADPDGHLSSMESPFLAWTKRQRQDIITAVP
jgi:uncharacterized protein